MAAANLLAGNAIMISVSILQSSPHFSCLDRQESFSVFDFESNELGRKLFAAAIASPSRVGNNLNCENSDGIGRL